MWTQFKLGCKCETDMPKDINIELPMREAGCWFREQFGKDWEDLSCPACDERWDMFENYETLRTLVDWELSSGGSPHRGKSLDDYLQAPEVWTLFKQDLEPKPGVPLILCPACMHALKYTGWDSYECENCNEICRIIKGEMQFLSVSGEWLSIDYLRETL